MRGAFSILPLLLLAAGCQAVDAPSLALRPAEKQPVGVPEEYVEQQGTVDPALAGRLAPIVAQAEEGHRQFKVALGPVEKAVAAAGPQGSESWIVAQQALSALDPARAPLQQASAAIEAVRAEPANAVPANRAVVDKAAAQIDALTDEEAKAIAALVAKLGG